MFPPELLWMNFLCWNLANFNYVAAVVCQVSGHIASILYQKAGRKPSFNVYVFG